MNRINRMKPIFVVALILSSALVGSGQTPIVEAKHSAPGTSRQATRLLLRDDMASEP